MGQAENPVGIIIFGKKDGITRRSTPLIFTQLVI